MRLCDVAIMLLIPATTMSAQGGPARPTVAVRVSAASASAADSGGALAALRRGLQTDSLVEFVDGPPPAMPPNRGAQFIVAALIRRTGDLVALNTSTFNVGTSAIAVSMSTTATAGTLGDSAAAVGRRIARVLAANRP